MHHFLEPYVKRGEGSGVVHSCMVTGICRLENRIQLISAQPQMRTRTRALAGEGAGSPDHLVGLQEDRLGDRNTEHLCGFQVDHQLESGRLLDGQVAWLGAFQDLVDISGLK